jgi:hypothetical protein
VPPLNASVRRLLGPAMRVESTPREESALASLAAWFHQDFNLMGKDAGQWGLEHIKSLSAQRRRILKAELQQFLKAYPGKSTKGARNAWVRLGAQSWPRSADLRAVIEFWVNSL